MKRAKNRALSFLLALLMVVTTVFGHVDYTVAAEETTVYKQVTDVSEITAGGNFVLVVQDADGNHYAMGDAIASKKIAVTSVSVNNGEVIGNPLPVWEIRQMEGGISFFNGTSYINATSSKTDLSASDTAVAWEVSKYNNTDEFLFKLTGTTRYLAYSIGNAIKAYAGSNIGGSTYDFGLLVFKETTVSNEPADPTACASVVATPSAGEVAVGTEVRLSCATADATIFYNVDGSDNYSQYDGSAIVINADTTIKAYASNGVLADSAVATFTYTAYVPQCADVDTSMAAGTVAEGTKIALKCETAEASIYYSTDANAGVADYILYESEIVLTESATIYAYAKANGYTDGNVKSYAYDVKKLATPFVTGEQVAIAIDDKLMSKEASGSKMATIIGTVQNDKIIVEEDTVAILDVVYDEATGYYTFTNNGKFLTSRSTGNALSFADSESDYSTWQILEASIAGTYLVKNVNAISYAKNQYLEYYNNTITTYGFDATKENIYAVTFYTADKVEVKATVTAPTIAPAAGEVAKDTAVTITNNAEGATVYYTVDGSDPTTSATRAEYTSETAIKVTENLTVKAVAVKDDVYSEVVSAVYTLPVEGGDNTEDGTATLTDNLKDGNVVVMHYPAKNLVLSTTASGSKLTGVEAIPADGKITVPEGAAELTVSIDANGYYTFISQDGKYLTSGATGNGLSFADVESDYSLWTLETCSNGNGFHITNVNAQYNGSAQSIEEYNGLFTTYGYNSSKDSIYDFSFYKIKEGTPTPTLAKPTIAPAAGEVAKDTAVTITNNAEGATVYYTVDGSDPTTSNTRAEYTSTTVITVTENLTVKAVAVKDGVCSAVVTAAYTLPTAGGESTETTTATLTDTLKDGNVVAVYNTARKMLLTKTVSEYNGNSQFAGTEVSVTDGKLTLPEDAMLLTVSIADDGTYKFISEDGKYLTSGPTGSKVTLESSANDYSIWTLEAATGGYKIKSVNANYDGKAQYLRYNYGFYPYSYYTDSEASYVMTFYKVKEGTPTLKVDSSYTGTVAQWGGGIDNENYKVNFVYGDRFVTNDQLDTNSKFTAVVDGKEVIAYTDPNNTSTTTNHYMGASGFGKDDYLQFATSSHGYANMDLSFRMRVTKAAPAEYTVQYSTDGVNFENFTTGSCYAKYTEYQQGEPKEQEYSGTITNGVLKFTSNVASAGAYVTFKLDVPAGASHAQNLYIRFIGSSTKASGATGDPSGNVRVDSVAITGNPVIAADVIGYVVAAPEAGEIPVGQELTLTSATAGATIYYSVDGSAYQVYDASNKPVLNTLPANVATYAVKDGKNSIVTTHSYKQLQCEMVKATPNGGAVVLGTNVTLKCKTEGATIKYAYVTEGSDTLTWNDYTGPIILEKLPVDIKVKAVKEGYLDGEVQTLTFVERENEKYNIYFGQLHSHTSYSDGAGTVEEAFQHATQVENLDFLAVTDHSNSFDEDVNSVISQNMDTASTNEWTMGHTLAEQYSSEDFTCLYGYEMTWSNGLGHINTFNTPGYQSRTQAAYKTYSTALQNYYEALNTVPDSLSMFNHPGTQFGDFSDFSYWSEENDALITMIEVGNGEGAIGSSGYFPSYEYYTRALDKGWHVSPTNNQDNHKGLWGDANTARSVVLADKNTEEHIYDAMRNNRMYATEDNNLSIYYTLDGYIMGTILEKDQVSEAVNIVVELNDADATDALGKVEVIVNGGLSVASKNVTTNAETVTFEVPTNYSYYYIKVTEADGDIAVTSPVWVGNVEACGINDTYTNAVLAVQGEAVDVNVEFYNNEEAELVIDSIEVKIEDQVIHTATADALLAAGVSRIAPEGTGTYSFDYVYDGVGSTIYEITVNATLNGVAKIYTDKLELSYTVTDLVTNVIIDGSHNNDYVTGYYAGKMGEFIKICADKNINAVIDTDGITAEELESCALLVISAPAKRTGDVNGVPYGVSHFEDEFIALVKDYVANGGSVIVCGLADYQDRAEGQTATEQNKLLEAIGATIRVNSDQAQDEVNHGGKEAYRLYPEYFNADSKWLAGVVDGQQYSAYSGCSVNIDNAVENDTVYAAEALVKGFETTCSVNTKTDTGATANNEVVVEKGKVVFLASQETKAGGNIFVSGAVFMSDYEVKAEMDNNASLPYMNYNIINNILTDIEKELDASPISAARKGNIGDLFAVEGYVTAGTANKNTTFFDSIYIQDETGGICVFPFSESGLEIGTKMKITGYIDEYQGEKEIQIISYEILDAEKKVYEPKEITTAQATDYDTFGGQLVKVTGTVTRVELTTDGLGIAEYWVKDESGVEAAVFIDGYILSGTTGKNTLAATVKVGDIVSGCGVLYKHPEGASDVSVPVLRVRDCDEIVRISEAAPSEPVVPGGPGTSEPDTPDVPATPDVPVTPEPEKPSTPEVDWTPSLPTAPSTPEQTKKPGTVKVPTKEEIIAKEEVVISIEGTFEEKLEAVVEAIKDVEEGQKIVVKVTEADENNVEVSIEVFVELEKNKEKDVNLLIELSNGLTWTINGNSVQKDKWSEDLKTINFFAEIVEEVVPAEAIATVVAAEQEALELSLRHNGEFGFTAALDIPVGEQYAGKEITLYYFNPETSALEKQDTEKVDEFGTIRFLFTHASDYVLVVEAAEEEAPVETPADTEAVESTEDVQTDVEPSTEKAGLPVLPIVVVLLAIAIVCFVYAYKSGKIGSKK